MTRPPEDSAGGPAAARPGLFGALVSTGPTARKAGLIALAIISLGIFGGLLADGPRFGGDSDHYIEALDFRSPGYVWLLQAYNATLGTLENKLEPSNYGLLVALQLLFGLAGAWVFSRSLEAIFAIPPWLSVILFLTVLTPYFFGDYRYGNTVHTEGLCYPLYLIGFSLLLHGVADKSLRPLFWFLAALLLLVLTRKQFLFVYPAFALVVAYVLFFFPGRLGPKLLLAAAFAATMLGAHLGERASVYARSGKFETIPFTGIQLSVAPIYFSSAEDRALFDDEPVIQELFDAVHQNLTRLGGLYESLRDKRVFVNHYYNHFSGSYNLIVHQTVKRLLRERGIEDNFEIDRITMTMALRLLRADPLPVIKLYFHNVKFGLGGYYMMLFIAAVFGLAFLAHLWRRDTLSICLFLATLFHLGNFTAVAVVEPLLRRYTTYTETLLTALLIVAVYLLLFRPTRQSAGSEGG